MSDIHKQLGNKIRKYRKIKKLTQSQLAELTGLSDNFIGVIERGEGGPTIKTLKKIADALQIKIEELFHFEEETKSSKQLLKELTQILKHRPIQDIKLLLKIYQEVLERFGE